MNRLYTDGGWNPYRVYVSGNIYELENIHLYDGHGVVVSTGHGWFGNSNNYVQSLSMPDIQLRRKPKFDGLPFVMSRARKLAELYVPIGFLGFTKTSIFEDHGYFQLERTRYVSSVNDKLSFTDYSKSIKHVDQSKKNRVKTLLTYAHALERALAPIRDAIRELDSIGQIEMEPFDDADEGLSLAINDIVEKYLYE